NGAANWPTFCFNGSLLSFASDDPSKPYTLADNHGSASKNTCGIFFSRAQPVEVCVQDITGNASADVIFGLKIQDMFSDGSTRSWPCTTNFVKTGAGTLQLNNYECNYVGDVVVSNGTLECNAGRAHIDKTTSTLGNPARAHTVYVEKDGCLLYAHNDIVAQFYYDSKIRIHVRGGTLKQNNNLVNSFGPLVLEDATLSYYGRPGESGDNKWPTFGFSDVTFKGTKAYVLSEPEYSDSRFAFGMNGMANVYVDRIVSDGTVASGKVDVDIGVRINDCAGIWRGIGPRKSTFCKTGPGVLKLSNISSNFSGDLEVNEGVYWLGKRGTIEEVDRGPLGNLMDANKTVRVCGTGELYFEQSDTLGQFGATMVSTLVVSNGTLRFKGGTCNGLPRMRLYDPHFVYANGTSSQNGIQQSNLTWGLMAWRFPVSFDGTKPIVLPAASYGYLSLGYSSDFEERENVYYGRTELEVNDITKDAAVDVTIGLDIQSLPHWSKAESIFASKSYRCGLLKTGAGTLRLTGKLYCPQPTRIHAGTLLFDGSLGSQYSGWAKSAMQVETGAYLGGSGTVESVTIAEGAGFASTPDATEPLKVSTVSLPPSRNVVLNLACTNDLTKMAGLTMPIVKAAAGLENANFIVRYNGGQELPKGYLMYATMKDGVVAGRIYKGGVLVIFR
ncbi:MAG: autotransporter-associated beta strand repeat-containing protein, partial [Treponema sp.]|nr:autotransporter-associated beta strand repeat-containing protein [Treponema sp.]